MYTNDEVVEDSNVDQTQSIALWAGLRNVQ